MKDIPKQIKIVFLPLLAVAIGTILLYSLVRWTFDIKFGPLPIKDDILDFWLPFFVPWIPITIWLRKRVRILAVAGKNDNGHFLYQFAMALAMAIPLIITQNYIKSASFQLVEVNELIEIEEQNREKYFSINTFEVNHSAALPYPTARTSGRHNDNLTYTLFFACPFEGDQANFWYGVEYKKGLSNNLDDAEKQKIYEAFIDTSLKSFQAYDFHAVSYFEKVGFSDERDGYLNAIKDEIPDIDESNQVILIPQSGDFETRTGTTFPWIFGSLGIGLLILLFMVIIPKMDEAAYRDFKDKRPMKDEELEFFLSYLNPFGPNPVTAILILLNIGGFIWLIGSGANVVSPTAAELLEFGGNNRAKVESGEYWRLFTAMFIHGGLMHLVMNLFGLAIGATALEGVIKPIKLLGLYLLSGLIASCISILWLETGVSVGASGAIFGLFGIILAFTLFKKYPEDIRGTMWMLLGLYVGISLLFGFLGNGIDNAAHIGGLVSGFILGSLIVMAEKER